MHVHQLIPILLDCILKQFGPGCDKRSISWSWEVLRLLGRVGFRSDDSLVDVLGDRRFECNP